MTLIKILQAAGMKNLLPVSAVYCRGGLSFAEQKARALCCVAGYQPERKRARLPSCAEATEQRLRAV